MKEKFVFQTAGAFAWETKGIFDSVEKIHEWIKENWEVEFNENEYESLDEWYSEMEINIIKTVEYEKI